MAEFEIFLEGSEMPSADPDPKQRLPLKTHKYKIHLIMLQICND